MLSRKPLEPIADHPATVADLADFVRTVALPVEDEEKSEDEQEDDNEDDEQPYAFAAGEAIDALVHVGRFVVPFLKRHRAGILLILAGLLAETAFNVVMPLSLKYLIDEVLGPRNGEVLVAVVAILAVAGIGVSAVAVWYEWIDARVAAAIVSDIRRTLFNKAQDLPPNFVLKERGGAIFSRFSNDLSSVETVVTEAASWALLPSFELIAGLALLFVLSWRLALLALLVFPLTVLGPRFIAPRAVEAGYRLKQAQAAGMGVLQEQISAQRTSRAFGLQAVGRLIFARRNRAIRLATAEANFRNAMVERSVTIAVLLLHLALFGLGAWMAFHRVISIGTFVTFENVFWELSYNIGHLTSFMPPLITAAGAVRHIAELTERSTPQPAASISGSLPRPAKQLRFEKVSFAYDGGDRVVQRLDLSIPIGQNVAIIGPSGAGKSTLVQLLLRLYEPDSGRITLDGADIAAYAPAAIRDHIGAVFQESDLFNATIAQNIAYGRLGCTQEEIEKAARAAEIHDSIGRMPHGYATMVGEGGAALSGGQRQRIALARAIVRDPAILLLDEATSALDQVTEAAVMRTIRNLAQGRTVIFITHRLSAIADFDHIIVMNAGKVVQSGRHEKLLAGPGLYRHLWDRRAA